MKGHIVFGFAVLLLAACNGSKSEPVPDEGTTDSLSTDSLRPDTTELHEDTPPLAADGLFDDFIYMFMKDRKFQAERVRFPLANRKDGQDRPVSREQWVFDRLYADKDSYTMIFDSERSMEREKDTAVHHVTVEWVYLEQGSVKQYLFDKVRGKWMLTALDHHDLAKNPNSDFYTFYRRFASDAAYQQEHIENPFVFKTYDYENLQEIDGVLDVDQWPDFRPALPDRVITNINYGQSYTDSRVRVFSIGSLSGGMNCNLFFQKKAGQWMLVKMEN